MCEITEDDNAVAQNPEPVAEGNSLEPNIPAATPAMDEQLLQIYINRVVDHDQAALMLLYESLLGQVYGLALRITRQAQLAEEVVQDTFWQVWRQAPRFDSERGNVRTWIMTIARSRALDARRRIETNATELDPETLAMFESSSDDLPPDLLAAAQQGQQLHTALACIDPIPRQMLSLAFFRGLSHDEIAEYTGLPPGTVKSHIRRALLTLRQLLVPETNLNLCKNESPGIYETP